ncbi:hypothetical protein ACFQ46_22715 [Kineococcus sp. GCM10028916]|uniref:hypothetical protein n=1 Tax=Kineococcus sp. GCM10028916 TaxID=3273394 RepID=UPI00363F8401
MLNGSTLIRRSIGGFMVLTAPLALPLLFFQAGLFGIESDFCVYKGVSPRVPLEQRVLERGVDVRQHWEWFPMGVRCDWFLRDGSFVTTTAATWDRDALAAGAISYGLLGLTLVAAPRIKIGADA